MFLAFHQPIIILKIIICQFNKVFFLKQLYHLSLSGVIFKPSSYKQLQVQKYFACHV